MTSFIQPIINRIWHSAKQFCWHQWTTCLNIWIFTGYSRFHTASDYLLFGYELDTDYMFTFVSPAIGATVQTFFFLSVLMTELLPTLGYPINPTLICFLSMCNCKCESDEHKTNKVWNKVFTVKARLGISSIHKSQDYSLRNNYRNTESIAQQVIDIYKSQCINHGINQIITYWSYITSLTLPNCLRSCIRAPLPNGFVMLAWKARVGYSDDSIATHFCWKSQATQINCKMVNYYSPAMGSTQ